MKQIIALACSPSKGRNSDSMLDAFITGAKKEQVEIEKIYLNDIPFENYSYENSKGTLPSEAKFKELTDKIQNSNGLIIATPTYNFSVPAHLKNFIDRIRFFALDFDKKTKLNQPKGKLGYLQLFFIVSGGTPTWAQRLVFFGFPAFWLRAAFLYFGAGRMSAIYSGDVKTYENKKILAKCERLGQKYAKNIIAEKYINMPEKIFWRPPQK